MKHTIAAILGIAILLGILTGCGTSDAVPTETAALETAVSETAPSETVISETGTSETVAADVPHLLEDMELAAAQLHSKLANDPNLTQADMNDLSYEIYLMWDGLLNDIWQQLDNSRSEEEMSLLTEAERVWIQRKEEAIDRAAAAHGGGSLAVLSANQQGAALTRERVYFLAGLLTGQEIPMPAEYNALYPSANLTALAVELFLPLADGRYARDYDTFLRSAAELGISVREDEGIFYMDDPDAPGSYLFGTIAQEEEGLMIPQLGYCRVTDSGERSVRVDFVDDIPHYFISAVFWDDGTPVETVQEMMDYLRQ